MNLFAAFLDAAPSTKTMGAIVGATFLVVFVAVAFVAFKALKKTAKMALRMGIVVVILLIGVVGSVSLWYFSSSGSPKLKPPASRPANK